MIEWLTRAFGLVERHSMRGPDGKVMHAEMALARSVPSAARVPARRMLNALAMRSIPIALCLASTPALVACGAEPDGPPPSVILISLDTLRAGHTSLYGYERETTPGLERLAAESAVYERAISTSCWTLISHMTMLTGLYPEQHGVVHEDRALSPQVPLLAERLQERGYQTVALFKPGWIHERYGEGRGFDVFRRHERADKAERHLWEELDKLDTERPFFLFLHLFDIHSALALSPRRLYYDPPPPFDTIFIADAPERLAKAHFVKVRDGDARLTPDQLEAMIALYDGNIRYVDSVLEGWIEEWRRRGLMNNSLLIITADHGESLGQRDGGISGHGGMYQDALHVPLLVRFPAGHLAGQRISSLVSHVDIMPTVLDCVGFPSDPQLPGYSLLGELPEKRLVFAAKPPLSARILGQWKLRERGKKRWLYDLDGDPLEVDPRAGGTSVKEAEARFDAAFAAEFEGRWFSWETIPSEEMDAALRDHLRQLGYAGDD